MKGFAAQQRGERVRIAANLPPRHGKTMLLGRYTPVYYLGQFPARNIIYVSATQELADEQGEAVRLALDEYGPDLFGIKVSRSSSAKSNWDVVDLDGKPTGGGMICVGLNSGVHGRNAHLLLLDDLIANIDDARSAATRDTVWRVYNGSLYSRLTPDGMVISLGTPLHSDDWFGRAKKAEMDGGDKWQRVCMPALAEETTPDGLPDPLGREPGEALWPGGGWTREVLEAKREAMRANGELRDWCAQYRLRPVSGDGQSEWPESYFDGTLCDERDFLPHTSVLSIDPSRGAKAQKDGDWQAWTFLRLDGQIGPTRGHFWVKSHFHREDFSAQVARAKELYEHYQPTAIVVETNNSGYNLWEALAKDGLPAFGREHASKEEKVLRISTRIGKALEMGILHFVRGGHTQILMDQLKNFPNDTYDDGPDSLEMGMEFIAQWIMRKEQRQVVYKLPMEARSAH